jgi:hypothetical protein
MTEILRLSLPISIWIVGFCAVYALQGLSCSRHWPPDLDARLILLLAWAVAVVFQAMSLWLVLYAPSTSRFVQTAATGIAGTALLAAVWTMMPVTVATVCQ